MLSLYNFCKTIAGNNRLNKVWKKVCTLAVWENKAPLMLFPVYQLPLSPFPLKQMSYGFKKKETFNISIVDVECASCPCFLAPSTPSPAFV